MKVMDLNGNLRINPNAPAAATSSTPPQGLAECRLTLTQGMPVTNTDVTGAASVYLEPYLGDQLALYDGVSTWTPLTIAPSTISLALGTLTSGLPYDVFAYNSSGTITLESLAWSSATARATALVLQNGVWVKSGVTTRRYLGSFRTTATTTTEDSHTNRLLFNCYNRVPRAIYIAKSPSNYTISSTSFVSRNSDTTWRVSIMQGLSESAFYLQSSMWRYNTNSGVCAIQCGVGEDSTSVDASTAYELSAAVVSAAEGTGSCRMDKVPAVGYHFYQFLEKVVSASGSMTMLLSSGNEGLMGTFWG